MTSIAVNELSTISIARPGSAAILASASIAILAADAISLKAAAARWWAELMSGFTSVRLKREQIQLVALDVVVGLVFDTGNRLTEQHFFEERH